MLQNPLYAGRIAHKGQVFDGQHPAIVDQATWDLTQELLALNRQGERLRIRAKNPILLAAFWWTRTASRFLPPMRSKEGVATSTT
jgi:hypothetical protein